MKKFTPLLALLIFTSQGFAQRVGINTESPKATLDVNGSMRVQPTSVAVVANAVTLPPGKGYIMLTGTSTGPITLSDGTGAADGTVIIITNNCQHVASLLNQEINPGKNMSFILTNGKYILINGEAGWGTKGNANTNPATHFIGTNDNSSLSFRTQNVERMLLTNTGLEMANEIKPNGVGGTQNQVLQNNGNGTMAWANAATAAGTGSPGFGSWGDCATNASIGDYNPVAMDDGKTNNFFGRSVSIDGDYAIIGAVSIIGGSSASIYHFDDGVWTFQQKLLNTVVPSYDLFGNSVVSINGDYAIVGASGEAGGGSASIYHRVGDVWTFQQKLFNNAAAAGDDFGISVSINGDYVIVGASSDDAAAGSDQGSASIYHRVGDVWILETKFLNNAAAVGDRFGNSVSIQGDYAIVGDEHDSEAAGSGQGSASIYHRVGSVWNFQTKLLNTVAAAGDAFGSSVSIHGDYAIVGARNDVISTVSAPGSASFYHRVGDTWTVQAKLSNTGAGLGDSFGSILSVAIHGDYAIVGAGYSDDVAGTNQGSATIYKRLGNSWQKIQYILDPNAGNSESFGYSVAIDAATKRFLIGAIGHNNFMGKAVFGKIN